MAHHLLSLDGWLATCNTGEMPSQHRDRALNVRPDTATREAAEKILENTGRDMTAFIDACFAMLVANPKDMLKSLDQVWRKGPKKHDPRRPAS